MGAAEAGDLQRCRARLAHLAELGPAPKDGALDWSRRRLDRILVDHLLRTGNYDSALQLASESGIQVRPARVRCSTIAAALFLRWTPMLPRQMH